MYKTLITVLSLFVIMVQMQLFAQNSDNSVARSKSENILNRIFDTKHNNYNRSDGYRKYKDDKQYQGQNQRKMYNKNQNRNRYRYKR